MNSLLIFSVVAITAALVFYTFGVFGERKTRVLKPRHVIIFWLGFAFDVTGTLAMNRLAVSGTYAVKSQLTQNLHNITGILAILLMLFYSSWATWVLLKNENHKTEFFHRFSIIVWSIWLIHYFMGMFIGMKG